jgi:hypothetical protein
VQGVYHGMWLPLRRWLFRPYHEQLLVKAHHYMYDHEYSKLSRTSLFLAFGLTFEISDGAFWSSSDDQDWTLMAWSD